MSTANHNGLSYPAVHSKQGVNNICISNDLEAVQSSLLNTSAKSNTPGFESTGPGFDSPIAGYEHNHPMNQQSSPVYESQDVLVTETSGPGLSLLGKLISLCT